MGLNEREASRPGLQVTDALPSSKQDGKGSNDRISPHVYASARKARPNADFKGRTVLVTGAAGSIGSALVLELARAGCSTIALLDHFDHALLALTDTTRRQFPKANVIELLCDIRSRERLQRCFEEVRPDIVIHAAALKHVDLGDRHPGECVLTNLIGVRNTVEAAISTGVASFLLISTDKAAAPTSVMGASKRLAELFLESVHRLQIRPRLALAKSDATLSAPLSVKAVRFGNVFGSQGSVVPKFAAQIAQGGPVELTHPDMERFFMSMEDAINLILDVSALEVAPTDPVGAFVLDMGDPVKIRELAANMIAAQGADVEIVVTGLREGEKLTEQLWDEFEAIAPSPLTKVHHVRTKSMGKLISIEDLAALEHAAQTQSDAYVRRQVFALLDRTIRRETIAI